jgi:NAD(P)-dependent dehydrogenase (short-subunit alcohol dehydrogenase family)
MTRKGTLAGKTIVMTGATDGIGRVVAERLAAGGARVGIVARDAHKGRRLTKILGGGTLFLADLASLSQIARVAAEIADAFSAIDVLINNAGVMKRELTLSPDGYEMNIAVNHLAVAALTIPLLDRLRAAGPGARIVNTNSTAHAAALQGDGEVTAALETWRGEDRSYAFSMAYSRSKLANLVWGYELAARMRGAGLAVNAVHPGSVRTALGRELPWLLVESYHLLFSTTAEEGAEPIVHLAISDEVAGVTGAYFDRFRQVRSSARSYDPLERRRVWTETARITGLDVVPAGDMNVVAPAAANKRY